MATLKKSSSLDLSITLGRLKLRNPVLLASGTCGYGLELEPYLDFRQVGGLVAKSVTLAPRPGNKMPRVVECQAGMLNAIGLANVGLEAFCREKAPAMSQLPCVVLANVAGSSEEEYLSVAKRLDRVPGIKGVELNVSCPNVHAGGLEFGRDPKVLGRLVKHVRRQLRKPLWVKLSPNVTDIVPLARAAEENGAEALTVINTLIGMRMDIDKQKPVLANITGGLSGPAIKPVALHLVYKVAGAVSIPVVGCGGIETPQDAIEFLLAGAQAVQVGTGTFRDPQTAQNLLPGLKAYMRRKGYTRIKQLVGAGRP